MCAVRTQETATASASFCLHFEGDRRGRGSERLTAGLLRFQAGLTGPGCLLGFSLACVFFLPKSLFPPHSAAMCQWVFAWNTEIACVLFYLSGIQREFPLQPTAGSGMSHNSPLNSPLTSSPPYPPLTLYFSSSPSLYVHLCLHIAPHFISFPLHVSFSICVLIFSGMAVKKALAWGEESVGAKAHTL